MKKLIFNTDIQEMPLGDGEGTVLYDPDKGDTHILDDVALDILNQFREGSTVESAIDELLKIYDTSRDIIEKDIADFVSEAEANNILVPCENSDI